MNLGIQLFLLEILLGRYELYYQINLHLSANIQILLCLTVHQCQHTYQYSVSNQAVHLDILAQYNIALKISQMWDIDREHSSESDFLILD